MQGTSSRSKRRRSVVLYLARLLITCALFAIALRRVDLGSVISVLAGVDVGRLVLSVLAFAAAQMLFAKRTQMLLSLQNMPASVLNVYALNLASSFYTLVIPSTLAGGVVRWHRMSAVKGERAQAFSVILLERILDNGSWLILLCAASVSLSLRGMVSFEVTMAVSFSVAAIAIVGWLALVLMRNGKLTERLDSEQLRFMPRSIAAGLGNIVLAVRNSVVSPREFGKIAGLSLALNAVFRVVTYNVLLAFVPGMVFDQYLFVSMLLAIVAQLPITIASVGLNETLFGRILPLLGMNSVSAMSVGVAGSTFNVVWSLIGGVFEVAGLGRYHKPAADR